MHTKVSKEEFWNFYELQKKLVHDRIDEMVSLTCNYLSWVKNSEIERQNNFARSFLGKLFKKQVIDLVEPSQFEEFAREYYSSTLVKSYSYYEYNGWSFGWNSEDWCGVSLLNRLRGIVPVKDECYLSVEEYNLLSVPYAQKMLFWRGKNWFNTIYGADINKLFERIKIQRMKNNGQFECYVHEEYGDDD